MSEDDVQGFRLSPHQRRAWSSWRGQEPGCRARCAILLEGPLQEEALAASLDRAVARHAILRTTYHRMPGMPFPLQVVGAGAPVGWQAGEDAAVSAIDGFDLERGPVLEARLSRLGAERHLLSLALPPLAADSATLDNLLREVAGGYAALVDGLPAEDGEGVPYVQFSEWQNSLADEEPDPTGREHWEREEAQGASAVRLPWELPAGGRSPFATLATTRRSHAGLLTALTGVAARCDSSLELVLLAAWQTLLWRMTGSEGLPVAIRHTGRGYDVLEGALGLFARWLPLRSRLRAGRTFAQVVAEAGRAHEGGLEWADVYPWREGEGGEAPDTLSLAFEVDEWPAAERTGGVSFRLAEKLACFEPFKLKLACALREGELELGLHWDASRFDGGDMERLADSLLRCLESAAADPGMAVEDLDILPAAERRRLLAALDETSREAAPALCFHQLFEAQAARTPEAPAVVCEGRALTYAELDAGANRLARFLRRAGVGPESLVALCLERSPDLVVALLGVLKAGGAYVPLEPHQPWQRLAFMLEDLEAPVVVVHEALRERLGEHAGRVVSIDGDRELIERESGDNPPPLATTANLAYVIFTSGSTGRPKGVAVEHRQLVRYISAVAERLELPAGASFANVSTFAADLGHTAIFPTLATGGCLHMLSQERATDAEAFAEYIDRHAIDCLKIVPSHFEALQGVLRPERSMPRRRLVLGGEASRAGWIGELEARADGCRILNHYGPSETTVGVLTFAAGPGRIDPRSASLPLGRPIAGTRVVLVDRSMQPVPAWTPGEIYIGGDGVSRGYLKRPELTADRFLPDPFSDRPGARLYRTGDLARVLPDGDVEFLGRVDDQVKFHGFRVELAEIRSALNRIPQVRDSVVTLVKDSDGRDVLIAYYVSRQELDVAGLREALRERILEETLPNLFVHLRKLPLTLNGKVNYAALPALEEARKLGKRELVAPRNATEEVMAGIWAEVLGLQRVSVHDNFFELGGHSLLATRVMSRQREAFQVDVPLRHLFEAPTVAGLAAVVERARLEPDARLSAAGPRPVAGDADLARQLDDLELLSDDEAATLLDGTTR